jgi:hypothetical protein
VQHFVPDSEVAMFTAACAAFPSPALRAAVNAGLGALAGAIDDVQRAALILRQESRPSAQRFRTPDDLRRIAAQFSERTRSCQAAQEPILAVAREIAVASPS